MEYFCYISRNKIDQLHQNITKDVDEWIEKQITEHDVGSNLSADLSFAGIIKLFKGGVTYGRKGIIQREKKVKKSYLEKLYKVLLVLSKDKPIPWFQPSLNLSNLDSIYFRHKGIFNAVSLLGHKANSNSIITIKTSIQKFTLNLDCSLRFFSEGNEPNGSFHVHSGNFRFFSGEIGLNLETVFIFLNRKENMFFGTPLYLKLSAAGNESDLEVNISL